MFKRFDNRKAKSFDPIPARYSIDFMVWQLCGGDATKAGCYWNMPYLKAKEWLELSVYDAYVTRSQF